MYTDVTFLLGSEVILHAAKDEKPLPVFAPRVLEFCNALSKRLRTEKKYPELVAFGYWCRSRNLKRFQPEDAHLRLGKGLCLHIAPGNVPLNFAYSAIAGLLSGCVNIVKLSSRPFEAADSLVGIFDELLSGEFHKLRPYLIFIKCSHDSTLLTDVSKGAACRVIWGGNETVRRIKSLPSPPRCVDVCFANRYSLAVIDVEAVRTCSNMSELCSRFLGDAYWSDQLACSAPRAVFWLNKGESDMEAVKLEFWATLQTIQNETYNCGATIAIDQWEAALFVAAGREEVCCRGKGTNAITRVSVPKLTPQLMEVFPGGGLFFESEGGQLSSLNEFAGTACQTAVSYGVPQETWREFFENAPLGIDRVCMLGAANEFSLIWDGYDLPRTLSRRISMGTGETSEL